MKMRCILAFLGGLTMLSAQTYQFEEVSFPNQMTALDFIGSSNKALTHLDVDGDGDEDIFLLKSVDDESIASLYLNDGNGNYIKGPYDPFPFGIDASVIAINADGDEDIDLIISGTFNVIGEGMVPQTRLYLNIGYSSYFLADSEFINLTNGAIENTQIAFDKDFIITGEDADGAYVTDFYFSPYSYIDDGTLPGVIHSDIAVVDINGDGENNLLLQGETLADGSITKAYTLIDNIPSVFEELTEVVLPGLSNGTIDHIDIDGDDDADILITGIDDADNIITKLYTNDGLGNLTEVLGTAFPNVHQGSVYVADFDGMNGPDVLMTGLTDAFENFTGLFLNDGLGNFTVNDTGFYDQFAESSSDVFDVDGDGDLDVILNGVNQANNTIIKLYFNDGFANFTEAADKPVRNIKESEVAFADVDADGDLDFAVTGTNQFSNPATLLYLNDGTGNYELSSNMFVDLSEGDLAFADIDGDDDLDLFNIGWDENDVYQTKIYINNGVGVYADAGTTDFGIIGNTSCAFADIDNDDDSDIILYGYNIIGDDEVLFYLNDGSGSFSLMESGIYDLAEGGFAVADVDGDGDIDFFQSGADVTYVANLYLNDGGTFSLSTEEFVGRIDVDILFDDIDNDDDQDLLLVGTSTTETGVDVYLNDGLGSYTLTDAGDFNTATKNKIALGDIDNDGDSDLLLTAKLESSSSEGALVSLYEHDGNGGFSEIENDFFKPTGNGAIAFADIDEDNDQDIFISGEDDYRLRTNLYRNETIAAPIFTSFTCEGALSDAVIDVENGLVQLYVSQDTDITSIIAEYSLSYDAETTIDDIVQLSGVTSNDFTNLLEYTLLDVNGDLHHWLVEIDYVSVLNVKLILEGAYVEELAGELLMQTELREGEHLPYYNPYTGEIILDPTTFEGGSNTNIVDWVEIEIRKASDPENGVGDIVIGNYYGFLRNDGIIVDTNGSEGIHLFGIPEPIYVVIKHRNHLSIMTSEAISPDNYLYDVDFTLGIGQAYNDGQQEMDGLAMMYVGDVNGDGVVKYVGANNDSIEIFILIESPGLNLNNSEIGYYNADLNMDGEAKYVGADNDDIIIFNQIDGNSNLNNQIVEELPEAIAD